MFKMFAKMFSKKNKNIKESKTMADEKEVKEKVETEEKVETKEEPKVEEKVEEKAEEKEESVSDEKKEESAKEEPTEEKPAEEEPTAEVQETESQGNGVRIEDLVTKDYLAEKLSALEAKYDAVVKENADLKDELSGMKDKYENKDFGGFQRQGLPEKSASVEDTFESYSKQFM